MMEQTWGNALQPNPVIVTYVIGLPQVFVIPLLISSVSFRNPSPLLVYNYYYIQLRWET